MSRYTVVIVDNYILSSGVFCSCDRSTGAVTGTAQGEGGLHLVHGESCHWKDSDEGGSCHPHPRSIGAGRKEVQCVFVWVGGGSACLQWIPYIATNFRRSKLLSWDSTWQKFKILLMHVQYTHTWLMNKVWLCFYSVNKKVFTYVLSGYIQYQEQMRGWSVLLCVLSRKWYRPCSSSNISLFGTCQVLCTQHLGDEYH